MIGDLNRRAAEIAFPDTVECGCDCGKHKWNLAMNVQMPEHFDPCNRIEHSRMLEDYIEEMGLWFKYVLALVRIVDFVDTREKLMDWVMMWAGCRATPEQRTRAFLEAVEGQG